MKTKITNRKTGEIKEIQLATQKQVDYLRSLEYQLGMAVCNHTNKPIWKAAKRIDQLQNKLNSKQQKLL